MAEPSRAEIEDFIRANDVDDRAAADLKGCPPDVQRKVLARGELSSARNPSAALLARIRDARVSGSGSLGLSNGMRGSSDVEDFIRANDVDESAADSLRSSSPTIQRAVLSRGELKTARNPSSALLARIRDAKMDIGSDSGRGSGGRGGDGGGSSIVPIAPSMGFPAPQGPGPPGPYGYPPDGCYAMQSAYGMPPPGYGPMYPGGPPGGPCPYGYPFHPGAAGMYPGYPPGAYGPGPGGPGMPPGAYGGGYGMNPYGGGYGMPPSNSSEHGPSHSGRGPPLPIGAVDLAATAAAAAAAPAAAAAAAAGGGVAAAIGG
eukprot:CAMPEP_0172815088 /NCGR_PEP_ID=MMETSP1075-20121228/11576_1 /TAXON_ID=2916 /ORGANISM="Ceratium fusus, Strain PA161109" /LENGTH=316 /DNA_ID=CAMNT_0013654919 /DNA_START=95 /DNA_END=1042 /DNA_ORIENTATION=+